jgi:hypothetical protein
MLRSALTAAAPEAAAAEGEAAGPVGARRTEEELGPEAAEALAVPAGEEARAAEAASRGEVQAVSSQVPGEGAAETCSLTPSLASPLV